MNSNHHIVLGVSGAVLALVGAGYATNASRASDPAPRQDRANEAVHAAPTASARVAWGDVDGDRLPDAVEVRPDGGLRLFHNAGDGTLNEVTERFGLAEVTGVRVALLEDLDGDGLADLFVGGAKASRLFASRGSEFVDVTQGSGLAQLSNVRTARALDYDADGRSDLFVVGDLESALLHALGDGIFEPVPLELAGRRTAGGSATQAGSLAGEDLAPRPADSTVKDQDRTTGNDIVHVGLDGAPETQFGSVPTGGQVGPINSWCVPTVRDQAGGCLEASSDPVLGLLYPMSDALNVSPLGRVGIGTTSPDQRLEIESAVNGGGRIRLHETNTNGANNPGVELYNENGFQGGLFYSEPQDAVELFSRGGSALAINGNSGWVGVGTRAPAAKLHVVDSRVFGTVLKIENTSTGGRIWSLISTGESTGDGAGKLAFYDQVGTRMTILPDSGFVGIGTSTPEEKLDVEGTARVHVLQITAGADIVEGFETSGEAQLEPGTVVAIDPESAGELMQSTEAYDKKVAGVVSGANGVAPGIRLGQESVMDGDTEVAMTGRVYVKCSTENGAIQPGDRLTTASLAGHAMKVTDEPRSVGAVIGKAMSSLDEGTGLVLVLVNLQ